MTLRRKMSLQIAATVVALLLVSAAALWGLNGLHQDYGAALAGYERLRQVYEASSHLATAQKFLQFRHEQTLPIARDEVRAAGRELDQLPPPGPEGDPAADEAVRAAFRELAQQVESPPAGESAYTVAGAQRDAISKVVGRIPRLAAGIRRTTEGHQATAQAKRRATILTVGGLAGLAVVVGLVSGVLQYRSVMRPLHRLGEGVRKLARGQFHGGRVDPRGGDEFAALANEFNRMAGELDGFYRELEQKVAAKSRELVRSERLAGIGYLAAGVAHEINNPLGIISGYAECSLAELQGRARKAAAGGTGPAGDANGAGEVEKSLQIIRDEAFRCKEITAKLLSLARPGDDNRQPVSLADVADHVASVVGGLRPFHDRRLVVRADDRAALVVQAVEAEMRQVVLNLTINALEAIGPGDGEVRIEVRRDGDDVELSVTDNGRGMTPQTLERVFEPFFTDKRGAQGGTGTGLGLSITHAIVESHGGRIGAASDGPGRGSRFTVRLPAIATKAKIEDRR